MADNSAAPFDFFNKKDQDQGFCDCFKDPACCLATCFCSCFVVGHVQGKLDGTDFNFWSCLCAFVGAYRIRRQVIDRFKKTNESEDGSMCAVGLCPLISICQTAHEATYAMTKRTVVVTTAAAPVGVAPPPTAPPAASPPKEKAEEPAQAAVAVVAVAAAAPTEGEAGNAADAEGETPVEEASLPAKEPTANDRVILEIKAKLDAKQGSASQPAEGEATSEAKPDEASEKK